MFQAIELSAQLAQERIEREIASAAARRQMGRRASPSPVHPSGHRVPDHRDRCTSGGGAITPVSPVPLEGRADSPARRHRHDRRHP